MPLKLEIFPISTKQKIFKLIIQECQHRLLKLQVTHSFCDKLPELNSTLNSQYVQLELFRNMVIFVLMTTYSHSSLNSLTSTNKFMAYQLLNGVTLNKQNTQERKQTSKQTKKPQPHLLYHKYAAHKANSVSGSVIK